MLLELPHSADCLVCGLHNPTGLHLSLFANPATNEITTNFIPSENHVGFQNILHGGILMTVADEAMAWAAIWTSKRLCLAAEVSTRFKSPARPGIPLAIRASVTTHRPRLLETRCTITNPADELISESTAKFIPLPAAEYPALINSLLPHPNTAAAASILGR